MREVFVLENMTACQKFMNEQIELGAQEDSFIGVGAFSSQPKQDASTGADVRITPSFLEQDLLNYIVRGYISIFELEPILIQPKFKSEILNIARWLILGQHTSIFTLPNSDVLKYIKSSNINTIGDFVKVYFNGLFSKINEIRAEIVILLFDFDMFKNYLMAFFAWQEKETSEKKIQYLIEGNTLDENLIKELIYFLSNAFFNSKIAIVPSSQKNFPVFLNTIRNIKNEMHSYSKDIEFKI